jgi:hypothetical protein
VGSIDAPANRFRSPGAVEQGQAAATDELAARAVAARVMTSTPSTVPATARQAQRIT